MTSAFSVVLTIPFPRRHLPSRSLLPSLFARQRRALAVGPARPRRVRPDRSARCPGIGPWLTDRERQAFAVLACFPAGIGFPNLVDELGLSGVNRFRWARCAIRRLIRFGIATCDESGPEPVVRFMEGGLVKGVKILRKGYGG
jgi:hypothetical protein